MKIEIKQIKNTGSNEFEIRTDGKLVYVAKLPFVSIDEPFNLDKIGEIKITDINGKEIYSTDYKYIENLKEEFIPFKELKAEMVDYKLAGYKMRFGRIDML